MSDDKTELQRLYFSAWAHELGETKVALGEHNTALVIALKALDPECRLLY